MSFLSKSNKNKRSESANTKDSLKKINISELLEQKEKENQIKENQEKENILEGTVSVSNNFSDASSKIDASPRDYLGDSGFYGQNSDKDGLDETGELPKILIVENPETEEVVFENSSLAESDLTEESVETTVENDNSENILEAPNDDNGEEMKIETIQVPRVFNNWYEAEEKNLGVFEAYAKIEASNNEKLIAWAHAHQNEFAKIWLGSLIPELETQYYITKIANYNKALPNLLVKTIDGKYVIKTNDDILDTDVSKLTEEEIKRDWGYLFENGFSELLED